MKVEKRYFVYMVTNKNHNVLYIGVTNHIARRITEHKNSQIEGFTKRYKVSKLVYVEEYRNILDALHREKELKGWRREKKNRLINSMNPAWDEIIYW